MRARQNIFWMTLILTVSAKAYDFSGGQGTPGDPYKIATADQLCSIGSDPNLLDKCFVLINNIDLDPNLPGGRVFSEPVIAGNIRLEVKSSRRSLMPPDMSYNGSFDGQGYAISNMYIVASNPFNSFLGLFGRLGPDAHVQRLCVLNAVISGDDRILICRVSNGRLW